MNKKKIELIITAFLVVFLIFFLLNGIKKGKERKSPKVSKRKVESFNLPVKNSFDPLDNKFNQMEWIRDPFKIAVVTLSRAGHSGHLKGIIWDALQPVAIFGDRLLEVGDRIKGFKILEIKNESVILSDGKTIFGLEMGESLEDLR